MSPLPRFQVAHSGVSPSLGCTRVEWQVTTAETPRPTPRAVPKPSDRGRATSPTPTSSSPGCAASAAASSCLALGKSLTSARTRVPRSRSRRATRTPTPPVAPTTSTTPPGPGGGAGAPERETKTPGAGASSTKSGFPPVNDVTSARSGLVTSNMPGEETRDSAREFLGGRTTTQAVSFRLVPQPRAWVEERDRFHEAAQVPRLTSRRPRRCSHFGQRNSSPRVAAAPGGGRRSKNGRRRQHARHKARDGWT